MKYTHYTFSDDDKNTLLHTLSVMPTVDIDNVSYAQRQINNSCCFSAAEKLANHRTDFHPNETRVMITSVYLADLILRNEIEVDAETKRELSQYMFSINRLLSTFCTLID